MTNYDLIFNLGSQYVSGATKQDGFFDKIPSAVAYQLDSKQIVAVGVDALRLANGSSGVKLVNPIMEGFDYQFAGQAYQPQGDGFWQVHCHLCSSLRYDQQRQENRRSAVFGLGDACSIFCGNSACR